MPDIAVIASVLTSLKTASDIAKLVKDSGSTLAQAEFKLKLADLVGALADAKMQIAEIQDFVLEKDQTIRKLENQIALKGAVEWDGKVYWVVEDGRPKDGPYCQRCYDVNGSLVRLQEWGGGVRACLACDKTY